MSAQKLEELIDGEYYSHFKDSLQMVKSGAITVNDLKVALKDMEQKIDDMAEDSEFFAMEQALNLLGKSEAIIQTISDYEDETKWDLLAAVHYFINNDDAIPDSKFLGLDDDTKVMEAVLNKHKIELI